MIAPDQTTAQIFSRLKSSPRPYVITGSQASYRYHRWLSPAPKVIELRIFPEDYEWWKNFLQNEAAHVSDIPPILTGTKSLDTAILLQGNLDTRIYQNQQAFAGLYYESAEDLCLELLQNSVAEITLMEILAIFLVQRQGFRWDFFCEQATVLNLTRNAGILLDVINEHTQQSLMSQIMSDRLFSKTEKLTTTNGRYYPESWRVKLALRRQNEKDLAITYPRTSRQWEINVVLPRYMMEKLVLDLDYALPHLSSASIFENKLAVPQFAA